MKYDKKSQRKSAVIARKFGLGVCSATWISKNFRGNLEIIILLDYFVTDVPRNDVIIVVTTTDCFKTTFNFPLSTFNSWKMYRN